MVEEVSKSQESKLLTKLETDCIVSLATIGKTIHAIIYTKDYNDTIAKQDFEEAMNHIHALQQMIMAQAASRAHPELFRLLGHKKK